MYFKKLPDHIKEAIVKLTNDKEFQNRFATDKRLDEIDEMKENLPDEYKSILSVLECETFVEGKTVKHITPAMWALLWIAKSPFVFTEADTNFTVNDIDFFLYLLHEGIDNGNIADLFTKSIGYSSNVLNIEITEALTIVIESIKHAFRPLKLFPSVSTGRIFKALL